MRYTTQTAVVRPRLAHRFAMGITALALAFPMVAQASPAHSEDTVLIRYSGLTTTEQTDYQNDLASAATTEVDANPEWFCDSGDSACVSALITAGIDAKVNVSSGGDYDLFLTFERADNGDPLSLKDDAKVIDLATVAADEAANNSYTLDVGTLRYPRSVTKDTATGDPLTPDGYELVEWDGTVGDPGHTDVDFMLSEAAYMNSGTTKAYTDIGDGMGVTMDPDGPCTGTECYELSAP